MQVAGVQGMVDTEGDAELKALAREELQQLSQQVCLHGIAHRSGKAPCWFPFRFRA